MYSKFSVTAQLNSWETEKLWHVYLSDPRSEQSSNMQLKEFIGVYSMWWCCCVYLTANVDVPGSMLKVHGWLKTQRYAVKISGHLIYDTLYLLKCVSVLKKWQFTSAIHKVYLGFSEFRCEYWYCNIAYETYKEVKSWNHSMTYVTEDIKFMVSLPQFLMRQLEK